MATINVHSSTHEEDSPLAQAAFLFAKKQIGRQVALDLKLKEVNVEQNPISARKVYHRKKRIRAQQISQRFQQAVAQMQAQQNWPLTVRRRINICNIRFS